ncbi:MAG: histidine phosphatase family protein [bacterium]
MTDAAPATAFESTPELPADARVWLIRHGETEWSANGRHTGRTDLDLTEHGVEQAEALRPLVATVHPALVLASPRHRSQRTAELTGLAVDAVDPDLAEWDYGDYEGLTTAQIRRTDPDWTVWNGVTPGGETAAQVTTRLDRLLQRVRAALPSGPVVLFGHGHINRALAARWLGLRVRDGGMFALGTAAPCLLGVEHARPVVVRWNMTNPAAAP